jgi:hypothetical protein
VAPVEQGSSPRPLVHLAGAAVALTVVACLLGSLVWPLPERTLSGWQIADVPPSLFVLITGTAIGCLALVAALVRPASLGTRLARATWWALGFVSVFALIWNDLYFAALAGTEDGAVIPVFDWLFTFVPALVAGLVTRRRGRATQLRSAVGTAVVTLPMLGLGWSLTGRDASILRALSEGVYAAAVFGVVPLLIAIVLTRAPGSTGPVATPP